MKQINFGSNKKYVTYSGKDYWLPPTRADIKTLHKVENQWKSAVKSQKLAETLTAALVAMATYVKHTTTGSTENHNETRKDSLNIKGLNISYRAIHEHWHLERHNSAHENLARISLQHNDLKISYKKEDALSHSVKVELADKTVFNAHVMPPESILHKIKPSSTRGVKINTIVPGMWIDQALDIGHIVTNYIAQQPILNKTETEMRAKIEHARNLSYPDTDLDLR